MTFPEGKNPTALARHALGLDGTRKVSYRNIYCAAFDTPEHETWLRLVEIGDAERLKTSIKYGELFVLTFKGASWVLREGERLDPEDFPEVQR